MACSRCGRQVSLLAIIDEKLVCIDCSGERPAVEGYQAAFDAFMRGESDKLPRMSDFMGTGNG